MEKIVKFFEWIHSLPIAGKVLSVLIILLVSIVLVFFSSCSVSQNVVTGDNSDASNGTTITVQIDSAKMTPTFKF